MRAAGLAFAAMFASAPGQSFLLAIFLDHLLSGAHLSRTAFSALFAGATTVSALAMPSVGRASDRLGGRGIWIGVTILLVCGCLLAGAAHGVLLAAGGLLLLRGAGQAAFPLLATIRLKVSAIQATFNAAAASARTESAPRHPSVAATSGTAAAAALAAPRLIPTE